LALRNNVTALALTLASVHSRLRAWPSEHRPLSSGAAPSELSLYETHALDPQHLH
jgi:hypothetical protein